MLLWHVSIEKAKATSGTRLWLLVPSTQDLISSKSNKSVCHVLQFPALLAVIEHVDDPLSRTSLAAYLPRLNH
ncbi:hypothetical protein Lalb_Chr09g0333131 [Lupinus albus]|uniref:Uncharacterized protein n=1 Tax=Lupinus albus TaxID=3870 RepID=A0A6A4NX01_LUPAL|nr:hypothetical protein Lalb_Chr20g0114011 [Lupinus albus]KAE9594117.1 hypothetical protein Lalb_Chr18g0050381 [Lupinus albus]KAE9607719.1 hypothetical protein Lalb_Chr09g0333131 [Lupinus albus]